MIERVLERYPDLKVPVIAGMFELVYEPDPEHPNTWFVNDHCLFQAPDGKIHYFGIENPYPSTAEALAFVQSELEASERPFVLTLHRLMHRHLYRAGTHYRIGHAVANSVWGPWKRLPAVLDGQAAGKEFGSPFVVEYQGRFWMLLPSETGLAVSDDLMTWQSIGSKTPWAALASGGHRDPCVVRLEDGTFLQYYAGADATGQQVINLARSHDLSSWEQLEPCFIRGIPEATWSGIYESPFVLRHEDLYYLFVCFAHRHYYETFVVVSGDPYFFDSDHIITTLFTHAPEFLYIDGRTYMTSCGIEDPQGLNHSGIWMSKICWLNPCTGQ